LNDILITGVRVIDLRFPTSRDHIGSDAVNKDPDYSAAYCVLETNSEFEGHGLTFTLGRGTDLVVQAARYRWRQLRTTSRHSPANSRMTHSSAGLVRRRASSTLRQAL
jgi:L-fuconate dehydratase